MKKLIFLPLLFLTTILFSQPIHITVGGGISSNQAISDSLKDSGPIYFIARNTSKWLYQKMANEICDGTADQVQINAAMTAGFSVKLSPDQFYTSAPITAAVTNITLEGSGRYSTIIYLSNGANCNVIAVGGAGWSIKHLKINGNNANNTGTCHGVYSPLISNCTIDDCEIIEVEDNAVYLYYTSAHWKILNTHFYNVGYGVASYSGEAAIAAAHDVLIENCWFENILSGDDIGTNSEDPTNIQYDWTVSKCKFTGTTGYMGIHWQRGINCDVINCYFDLGQGIGAVDPACVRYYNGASGKVIGNTFVGAGDTDGFALLHIYCSSNIVIANNSFTHTGSRRGDGILFEAQVLSVDIHDIIIEGNTFYNISTTSEKQAIVFNAASGRTISKVNIIGNTFLDDRGAGSFCTYGILNSIATAGVVKNIKISGNTAEGLLNGFVYMGTASDNWTISDNTIIDEPVGITADDGDDLQISGNKFISCVAPIDVNDSDVTRPLIEGNTMYGCTNSGTYAGATGELFDNNLWHDGSYDATNP